MSPRSRSIPTPACVEVVKYTMVNDFGTVINPLLVEGQSHGGVVQGIGQALFEHVVYSEEGQPLTGSFTDYALPRAADAPSFSIGYHSVPAKTNVLGAKGCGEAGCAGSLPSVMNAIVDALGGKHINMPATPERVWEALELVAGSARLQSRVMSSGARRPPVTSERRRRAPYEPRPA